MNKQTLFGNSDPLASVALQQQLYNQQARQQLGIQQSMAGTAVGMGMANAQISSNGAYAHWGQHLTPAQIRDKTRNHIANEIERMAEEMGTPTLLHAVALAVRSMEIPE